MEEIGRYLWLWLLLAPFLIGLVELSRTRRLIRHTVRQDDESTVGVLRPA